MQKGSARRWAGRAVVGMGHPGMPRQASALLVNGCGSGGWVVRSFFWICFELLLGSLRCFAVGVYENCPGAGLSGSFVEGAVTYSPTFAVPSAW